MWWFGFLRQSLCIFYKVAKSLGFCFKQGKEKTKQKDFVTSFGAKGIVNHRPTLIIA